MSTFRYMKTTQEHRALKGIKADSRDPYFENFSYRPNRSMTPHAYDDICREDKGRSWKNYRRTKWRA